MMKRLNLKKAMIAFFVLIVLIGLFLLLFTGTFALFSYNADPVSMDLAMTNVDIGSLTYTFPTLQTGFVDFSLSSSQTCTIAFDNNSTTDAYLRLRPVFTWEDDLGNPTVLPISDLKLSFAPSASGYTPLVFMPQQHTDGYYYATAPLPVPTDPSINKNLAFEMTVSLDEPVPAQYAEKRLRVTLIVEAVNKMTATNLYIDNAWLDDGTLHSVVSPLPSP